MNNFFMVSDFIHACVHPDQLIHMYNCLYIIIQLREEELQLLAAESSRRGGGVARHHMTLAGAAAAHPHHHHHLPPSLPTPTPVLLQDPNIHAMPQDLFVRTLFFTISMKLF